VLARVKNEIGIENLPALAGGLVLVAGAWLTLVGALAGQAVGGLVSSVANLGTALVDGISSFFGGEGTKSPFDLLNLLLDKASAVKTVSKSLYNVGESYVKIAANTNAVINGLGAWGKFTDEDGADTLERSADASERLAVAYGKFANAANRLNIKNVQASTQMFRAIADLGKKDALSGMKKLTDELLKAVEQLSKTVVNLETAVEKQGDNQEGLLEQAGNVIGGAVDAAKNLIKGASTTVDKNTPKTPEQKKEAEAQKAAMDAAKQQELIDALESMNTQLSKLVNKFSDSSGTNAPYVRLAQ
jgi:archaellum component FlaC